MRITREEESVRVKDEIICTIFEVLANHLNKFILKSWNGKAALQKVILRVDEKGEDMRLRRAQNTHVFAK